MSSSGFTDEQVAQEIANFQQKKEEVYRNSTKVASNEKTSMKYIHLNWVSPGTKENKMPLKSDLPPLPRQFGKAYRLTAEGIFTSATPGSVVTPVTQTIVNGDGKEHKTLIGYDVRCTFVFIGKGATKDDKEKNIKDVKQFILNNKALAYDESDEDSMDKYLRRNIQKLIAEDSDEIREHTTTRLTCNDVVQFELVYFNDTGINADMTRLNRFGLRAVRKGVLCDLEDVFPKFTVSMSDDGKLWVNGPTFEMRKICPTSTGLAVNVGEVIRDSITGDQQFCMPISLIREGDVSMPKQIPFYICDGQGLYNNTIVRNLSPTNQAKDYITMQKELHHRIWVIRDTYYRSDGNKVYYHLVFHAWAPLINAYGVDQSLWYELMFNNQSIDFYLIAQFKKKDTLALQNNSVELQKFQEEFSDGNQLHTDGIFHFSVLEGAPDYATWLRRPNNKRVLQLTADQVLTLFTEVNKKSKDNPNPKFNVDKGDDYSFIKIDSVAEDNPLHFNGALSPVINLGSAFRPMFSCTDATNVFREDNEFFVIFGVSEVPTVSDFLTVRGKDQHFPYQVFVLQNFKRAKAKK